MESMKECQRMTKKELYNLSLCIAQGTLRTYFNIYDGFEMDYFKKQVNGKKITKKIYDMLEAHLVDLGGEPESPFEPPTGIPTEKT